MARRRAVSPRSSSRCLYALSLLGWAWAVAPISRQAALATALVLLVTPTYAGLFHDVSSDPVFAFVLAWWAGAVVRAWNTGATLWLAAVGVGVALLTLCRPASQVALLACVLVPLVAPPRGAADRAGSPSRSRPRCCPSAPGRRTTRPLRRLHRRARQQGLGAVLPRRRRVDPANGPPRERSPTPSSAHVLPLPPYASRDVDVADVLQRRSATSR